MARDRYRRSGLIRRATRERTGDPWIMRRSLGSRERRHAPTPWCSGFCTGEDPHHHRARHPVTGEDLGQHPSWEQNVSGTQVTADHRGKAALAVIVLLGLFLLALYLGII